MKNDEYMTVIQNARAYRGVTLSTVLKLAFPAHIPSGTLLYGAINDEKKPLHLFVKNGVCYFERDGNDPEEVETSDLVDTFYKGGYLCPELCSAEFCKALCEVKGPLPFTRFSQRVSEFSPYAKDVSGV